MFLFTKLENFVYCYCANLTLLLHFKQIGEFRLDDAMCRTAEEKVGFRFAVLEDITQTKVVSTLELQTARSGSHLHSDSPNQSIIKTSRFQGILHANLGIGVGFPSCGNISRKG